MKKKRDIGLKLITYIILFLVTVASGSAQIAIDSFHSSPATVQPGEEIDLKITLENVGEEDITGIVISLDLNDVPFAPIESSSEKVIDEIQEGDKEILSFPLLALSDAEAQTYKIPVTITYEDSTKTSLISLEVVTDARLNVLLEDSELFLMDEPGKVTIKMVNEGLTQIKFLEVTLLESSRYEILSPSTLYIGEVDTGDFETEEFTILPKTENPDLTFRLEYRDTNNKEFVEEEELSVTVYSTEKAKELGLIKENNVFTWLLILLVLALAIGVWLRRKHTRKNAH